MRLHSTLVRVAPVASSAPDLAAILRDVLDWSEGAVCAQVDPDAWFPDKGGSVKEAKRVCATCPLTGLDGPCLQYALDNGEESGIWGGLSSDERRKLQRQQRRSAASSAGVAA
jgi:WhiB family redox-sensing transcriptional regulator